MESISGRYRCRCGSCVPYDKVKERQPRRRVKPGDNAFQNTVVAIACIESVFDQSAVGKAYDALTAEQVRALFAKMLWEAGALNNDGTVKPLGEWVR